MAGILDTLRSYLEDGRSGDYEVDEYVLERREPDPEPRVATYDDHVSPEDVEAEGGLPSGTYLLQEVKTSGMAGEVMWEDDLEFGEEELAA